MIVTAARLSVFGILGIALGLVYFHALRRSIEGYPAQRGWLFAALAALARLAAAATALALIARAGAGALLVAFLGFLTARALSLRRATKAA